MTESMSRRRAFTLFGMTAMAVPMLMLTDCASNICVPLADPPNGQRIGIQIYPPTGGACQDRDCGISTYHLSQRRRAPPFRGWYVQLALSNER